MADLIFSRPPYSGGPVHLVFGGTAAPAPAQVVGAVVLGGVSVSGAVQFPPAPAPAQVVGTLALGGVTIAGLAAYDNRNPRRATTSAALPHQVATPTDTPTATGWHSAARHLPATATGWVLGQPSARQTAPAWQTATHTASQRGTAWVLGQPAATQAAAVHQTAKPVARQAAQAWQATQRAQARAAQAAAVHQRAAAVLAQALQAWQVAARLQRQATARHATGTHRAARLLALWQVARPVPMGREVWPKPVTPGQPPRVPSTHLVFACPPWAGGAAHLVFGRACYKPVNTVFVPVRRVYMVFNEVTLRRVDGNIALPADSVALNLDSDSWAWGFSASLPGSALANLEPASSGAPVELEATINGTAFRVLAESITRERTFGQSGIKVQGRGKTALLDLPYAPALNFGNVNARTAQQLMADVLSINGVPLGWDLDWQLTDWLVPAQVFAHQGSYISALNAIAGAAGGYMQPHASLQRLSVLARYPVAPWNWAADVTPDFQLPADVTTREGIQWVERTRYNRVFVSGQQQGVLGQVTRTGTAGDVVAPMVTDALITHADAARQRGTAILSATGRQANITLNLPVLPETGIITPGKFVRYTDAGLDKLGLVRSVSVSASFPDVFQTIGVESYA